MMINLSAEGTNVEIQMTSTTCRICLHNNKTDNNMFPIFIGNDVPPVCDKINICTGIKITNHEKLPDLICHNCLAFLNIAFKFRSICLNSQMFLQEYVCDVAFDSNKEIEVSTQQENQEHITHKEYVEDDISHKEYVVEDISHKEYEMEASTSNTSFSQIQLENTPNEYYEEEYYDETTVTEEVNDDIPDPNTHIEDVTKIATNKTNDKEANDPSPILAMKSGGGAVTVETDDILSNRGNKTPKKPHVCDICGNVYDRRYSLQAHLRRHRAEKPFECELCGQSFHCNFELSRHIRKHTGSKPYVCEYCKRSFGDRSTLMKHERIHRNERPYSCETCGKTFTYSSVLKVHKLTHTGFKAYACELCGKRFSRSHHLRAHLETLLHSNDPRSKTLLKKIRRNEGEDNIGKQNTSGK
ncbi:uncharacterized protein LOC142220792 [Haematobia irritans]|uniref:uncharacterized protein LOC142220792 n=1 Tax=Haematobia irritans TaxID=7368 RepID=UPI003F50547F